MKAKVENGAYVNVKTFDGASVLEMSTWKDENLETVIYLVNNGADTEDITLADWARSGWLEKVIGMGDNDSTHSNGGVPLRVASENGHIDMVKFLIEQGADVTTTYNRDTALSNATKRGYKEIIELLKSAGAKE